jgi:hypothetical protein
MQPKHCEWIKIGVSDAVPARRRESRRSPRRVASDPKVGIRATSGGKAAEEEDGFSGKEPAKHPSRTIQASSGCRPPVAAEEEDKTSDEPYVQVRGLGFGGRRRFQWRRSDWQSAQDLRQPQHVGRPLGSAQRKPPVRAKDEDDPGDGRSKPEPQLPMAESAR